MIGAFYGSRWMRARWPGFPLAHALPGQLGPSRPAFDAPGGWAAPCPRCWGRWPLNRIANTVLGETFLDRSPCATQLALRGLAGGRCRPGAWVNCRWRRGPNRHGHGPLRLSIKGRGPHSCSAQAAAKPPATGLAERPARRRRRTSAIPPAVPRLGGIGSPAQPGARPAWSSCPAWASVSVRSPASKSLSGTTVKLTANVDASLNAA